VPDICGQNRCTRAAGSAGHGINKIWNELPSAAKKTAKACSSSSIFGRASPPSRTYTKGRGSTLKVNPFWFTAKKAGPPVKESTQVISGQETPRFSRCAVANWSERDQPDCGFEPLAHQGARRHRVQTRGRACSGGTRIPVGKHHPGAEGAPAGLRGFAPRRHVGQLDPAAAIHARPTVRFILAGPPRKAAQQHPSTPGRLAGHRGTSRKKLETDNPGESCSALLCTSH